MMSFAMDTAYGVLHEAYAMLEDMAHEAGEAWWGQTPDVLLADLQKHCGGIISGEFGEPGSVQRYKAHIAVAAIAVTAAALIRLSRTKKVEPQ